MSTLTPERETELREGCLHAALHPALVDRLNYQSPNEALQVAQELYEFVKNGSLRPQAGEGK